MTKDELRQRKAELQEDASQLSDNRLIGDLLAGELEQEERTAFESMRAKLASPRSLGLSARQREWAEKVYVKTHLNRMRDDPGQDKKPTGGGVPTFWWELPQNRPLRPPGMRCQNR